MGTTPATYLTPVGVGSGVRHAEDAGTGVLQNEVLVRELVAVDALPSRAVVVREVPALAHESGYDAVEGRSGEAESLLALSGLILVTVGAMRAVGAGMSGGGVGGNEKNEEEEERESSNSPVHNARKFSAVFGTTSPRSSMTMRPAGFPPMVMSK